MSIPSKHGVDDMVMLKDLSNSGINQNLKIRFEKDLIYTYIGHVLISVNPFKAVPNIYSDQTLQDYRGKFRYEMPPHVFSLADDMYRSMVTESISQCVIISGESGAGKTEASKKILQYVAALSGRAQDVVRVKDVILDSNPLLEAFGNAKTIRNNNSSRFGKYMEIQFDRGGDPRGGRITNYLLEKSRVVFQAPSERSFHVFYQLLKADSQLKNELRLTDATHFYYTNQGKCYEVEGIDDVAEFKDTVHAMSTMGFTAEEQKDVWKLVAAILHLGNVQFVEDEASEAAKIANVPVIQNFADLMSVDVLNAVQAITLRTIQTGANIRGSVYQVPLNASDAAYSRDGLAKSLYSRLFDYIVRRINISLGWSTLDCRVLGVLDIYGFEIFEKNGFEQLCINYVNEKLQQIFINLTLKEEQEEYNKEAIEWEPIEFFNNKICCDLIESSSNNCIGIFKLLDDMCNIPKGTDEKFVKDLTTYHGNHEHLKVLDATHFEIVHYAGSVVYDSDGMLSKNKDTLLDDHVLLCQNMNCSSPFINSLFPDQTGTKARPTSASHKIKTSIGLLVTALSECQPHYIRCIKPNDKKAPNNFHSDRVEHQVKYLGLLENVKVRRAGYAYRSTYDKFLYRYAICCDKTWPVAPWIGKFKEGTLVILESLQLGGKKPFCPGTTKIFIRAPETVFSLEEIRERKTYMYALRLQRFFLKNAMANYYYKLKKNTNDKLVNHKCRRKLSLNRDYQGDYINYRENFALKAIVGKDAKIHFADAISQYEAKKQKPLRRVFIITEVDVILVKIDKNKEKTTKKQQPFVYVLMTKIHVDSIEGIQFSCLADNFFLLKIAGETPLLENRRKTEILAVLLKLKPSLSVSFNNNFNAMMGKKPKPVAFTVLQGNAPPFGMNKKKQIMAPLDLPTTAYPDLKEPPQVTKVYESKNLAPTPAPLTAPSPQKAPSSGPPSVSPRPPNSTINPPSTSPRPPMPNINPRPPLSLPTEQPGPPSRPLPSGPSSTGLSVNPRPINQSGNTVAPMPPPRTIIPQQVTSPRNDPSGTNTENIPEWKRKLMEKKPTVVAGQPPPGY